MKKLFALLLAMIMVFALVACGEGGGKEESGKTEGVVHKLVVLNNLKGLTTKNVPWAADSTVEYPGMKIADVLKAAGGAEPSDDTVCWFVAGTDKYAANKNWGEAKGELYIAIEDTPGKGRTPITCGTANDKGSMPFNCELFVFGETAILALDVPGTTVGKISGWLSYMKDADIAFDSAENYTFTLTDGTTKTVAKADVDTVDLKTVASFVAG